MTTTYPVKKLIGIALVSVGIVALSFCLEPLWVLFIHPASALLLAAVAAHQLCTHPPSPRLPRLMEFLAGILIVTAALTFFDFLFLFLILEIGWLASLSAWDWLGFGCLLIPQLLWFPRLRSRPLAALVIALVSLVPAVLMWRDLLTW